MLSDADVMGFCSLLFQAGGETTDKTIASMFKNLLEHPDQLEAVRADRSLVSNTFAETLRYSPPVHMIMREPSEDVEMSGGTVAAGKTVTCLIGSANRDPEQYSDPDTFNIFRKDLDLSRAWTASANHVAFCLGRHFCLGSLLAKQEIELGVNHLLDAMPNVRFANGFTPYEVGLFTRAPAEMHLEFDPA